MAGKVAKQGFKLNLWAPMLKTVMLYISPKGESNWKTPEKKEKSKFLNNTLSSGALLS